MKEEKVYNIPVEDILPNRFQPRIAFDEKELNDLSNSIKRYGIIQPIVLRQIGNKYEIIAGERRYKASLLAGLKTIPAIINNTDDNTSAEIALLENLQRKNLTVIEEAQSYKKLLDRNFTQDEIANKLGVSQSSVANKLRLLNLPQKVQDSLLYNKISERHARSLLSLNDEKLQIELLDKIINERLTVRQTEEEISKLLNKSTIENDIPKQIKEIIEIKPFEEETINNIQTVQNKEDRKEDNISPFQIQFENKLKEIEESVNNNNESYYDRIINNDLKKYNFDYTNDRNTKIINTEIKEENNNDKEEKNIPKTISNIRNYINSLGNNIKITEHDFDDKYQIIINIEKDKE